MTLRRALALVLSLLLPASPAAAQVRAVPAGVRSAPLAAGFPPGALAPAPSFSQSAPALGLSLAPSFSPLEAAPRPAAAVPAAPVRAAALAAAPIPATAKPAVLAPRAAAFPIAAEPFRAAAASPGEIPAEALDALFDGSAPRSGLAAAAPETRPSAPRPALLSPKNAKRAKTAAAISIPLAAGAAVFGAVSPHVALAALHWLGQAAYWLANPFAFAFTIPQIHTMLSRRSASISASMIAVGFLSTAAMAANMAFDGKDLMLYRNLAQAGGFAAMFVLKALFARASSGERPSRRRAALETGAIVLAGTGILVLLGPAMAAAIPGIAAMHALLVPVQVVSGFGFTYLMYAQLTKMAREHSAGDSSREMMWAYLGTKSIWLWSFATMMSLAAGPAWLVLSLGSLFIGVSWFAGQAALSHLLHSPWNFLPEKLSLAGRSLTRDTMADTIAFVALSALILALSAGGWFAFTAFLGVPAAAGPRFGMYLLYTVQSLIACLATLRTLRMRASLDKK